MVRSTTLAAVVLLAAASTLAAETPGRHVEPWRLDNDARAAARLDPAARQRRLEEHRQALQQSPNPQMQGTQRCDDLIDGNRHPELLFPIELFRDFVRSAYVTLPRVFPAIIQANSSDLFRDPDEWHRFTSIVDPYVALLLQDKALSSNIKPNAAVPSELALLQQKEVDAATLALRLARREFGRERMDRALYEVVAKSTVLCHSDTTGDQGRTYVETMLRREKAAQ